MARPLARLTSAAAVVLTVVACAAHQPGPSSSLSSSPTPSASRSAAARPATVVGIGDSVMSGTNCGCAGITAEYASAIHGRTGAAVRPIGLGAAGAVTGDVATDLRAGPTRRAVGSARVVLVVIGANDLAPQLDRWRAGGCPRRCYQPAVEAMGRRLGRIMRTIASLRPAAPDTVLVADYWNVFLDGPPARADGGAAEVSWSRRVSRSANAAICAAARAARATCVDTYRPFLAGDDRPDEFLSADGDHPNAAGVALIVRRLVAATPDGTF